MSSILKTAATIGVLILTLGSAAQAADLRRPYPTPPPAPLPPPMVQSAPSLVDEFGSGWYLRGDVAYRSNNVDSVTNVAAVPVTSDDLRKSWMIGVGGGYKWQWFRADLTLDYATKATYLGTTARMPNEFFAKIDTFTGLVNIYGALGTWWGLTPYLGAGVGTARLGVSKFEQHFVAPVTSSPTTDKWNFAWAYMAGISYKISGNFNVDLGYRHIDMGDAVSARDAFGNQLTFKSVTADEIRLGVRYLLD